MTVRLKSSIADAVLREKSRAERESKKAVQSGLEYDNTEGPMSSAVGYDLYKIARWMSDSMNSLKRLADKEFLKIPGFIQG